jgi:hypothetical protein
MRGVLTRLAVLAAVGGAVVVARPGWLAAAGLDVWHLPALRQQIETDIERAAAIDAEEELVETRILNKDRLAAELAAGRTTLAAATDEFLAMNHDRPVTLAALRETYRSADDRELAARNVLGFVEQHRFPTPAAKAAALARLAADFRRLFPAAPL